MTENSDAPRRRLDGGRRYMARTNMRKVLLPFSTLRGRLVLLISLATLPAILFTFYLAHKERGTALERMEKDAHHIVSLISREHLYQLAGAKSLLGWLSDRLEMAENETLVTDSDFLAALLAGHPQLGNIAILTADGEVINSAYPLPGVVNMHDYDAIQRALQSTAIETGSYVIGPIVKRPLLHLAYAVRGDRQVIRWVVFVAIDLEWLEQLTEKAVMPADHILLMSDREGRILAGSATPGAPAFSAGRTIPELAGLGQRQLDRVVADIGGQSYSFVTAPMEGMPGVLVASALPWERIYQKANDIFYRTLGLLGLLTLFTVVSVLVVEEVALLRVVRALSGATQKFGGGDYSVRVAVPPGYGELQNMANAFNRMAETLTRRHREITQAQRRLGRLTRHLQVARETEAQRISRDLHDEVGQVLTSIKMDLARFQKKCAHAAAPETDRMIGEEIDSMRHKIDHTVVFIRRLASDLRPPVLDRMGLAAAIDLLARNLEDSGDLVVEVDARRISASLDWLVSTTIYRLVQEALTNISRHAGATEVHITLEGKGDRVILTITDNGRGFKYQGRRAETLGLTGMRERARLIGGRFSLKSTPGKGTRIRVSLPLKPRGEEADTPAPL